MVDERKGLTRREFLKAAGVTAAGMVVSSLATSPAFSLAPPRVLGANDRIRIGYIGVGGQGVSHMHTTLSMAQDLNLELVAVCDVWDKRIAHAQGVANLPASKAYHDYRKLLEDKDVDAVLIATPEHWHSRIAIEALESGRPCYIEKPMTRHLDEALKLREAAKRTKLPVQIGSQFCSQAIWHRAHDLIKEGRIGKIVWSQGSYSRNNPSGEWNYGIDPEANATNVDWKSWLGPCKQRPWDPERYFRWRKYLDYSAGILSDLFPHRLHPLMIAIGAEYPTKVACVGTIILNPDHPDREVADNTQLLIEFPSGNTMVIAGATCNEQGLQDMVRGTKATMYFGGSNLKITPERPYAEEIDELSENVQGPGGGMNDHQKNWIDAIRTGAKLACDIELATKVQVIVCLAEKSWREGKMMKFDAEKMKVI